MKKKSLNDRILDYLKSGETITSLEALNRFNCLSLAARIHNIRKRYLMHGEQIVGEWEHNPATKKKYLRYSFTES